MCLILFAINPNYEYKLILAANRDEFFERPTERAEFWGDEEKILAGKDLRKEGTWLGVSKRGRFSAITNFRPPQASVSYKRSRGELPINFLESDDSPEDYLNSIAENKIEYNGFNLLVGDLKEYYYSSNRIKVNQKLGNGFFGLSNEKLNCSWPKVRDGRRKLARLVEKGFSNSDLYKLLEDTGSSEELSASFIHGENYGTRAMTILTIDSFDNVLFEEKTFGPLGKFEGLTSFGFMLEE